MSGNCDNLPPVPSLTDLVPLLSDLTSEEQQKILEVMKKDKLMRQPSSSVVSNDEENHVSSEFESISLSSRRDSKPNEMSFPSPRINVDEISNYDNLSQNEIDDEEDIDPLEDPVVMTELDKLTVEERIQILDVMRKDMVVKLNTEIKVR